MGLEGIDYVSLSTHNWGRAVRFWRELGFEVVLDLGDSGELRPPDGGPGLWIEEVPEGHALETTLYLRVDASDASFEDSHWDTRLKSVTDPDGRGVILQHWPSGRT